MTQQKNKIKIWINNGTLTVSTNREFLPKGTCKNCHQIIYWVKIFGRKKWQISKYKDGYILHNLVCPVVLKYKQQQFIKKESKKYDKRRNL